MVFMNRKAKNRHQTDLSYVLGIETSCDETAVAIVTSDKRILAHQILSQIDDHADYGGVVPEIAARAHISHLDGLIRGCLQEADLALSDIDAIACTTGPGLIGGLMVGVMTAKAMAAASDTPFIAINHLAAHALVPRLTDLDGDDTQFPYLLLLMSGGHCQLVEVLSESRFKRLGTTLDDAAGEAFDKTAKLLGLGYPGGPRVEAAAHKGDSARFSFPQPLKGKPGCDFSFSGLKTAVRRAAESCVNQHGYLIDGDINDLCASFQSTMARAIVDRLSSAMALFSQNHPEEQGRLIVAGGVAANQYLRAAIQGVCDQKAYTMAVPPPSLCTDNGAMIAWAGMERWLQDPTIDDRDVAARPRWPLDETAEPLIAYGKKGAKA